MTAIASLLSTTAVTLPGASAPTGVTTLAPFPDLGVAQAVNVAVVPASSGRQAIAGGGNALPVATVDADALAWLDPALSDAGGSAEQVAREVVASSPLTAGGARLLPSERATIVSAASAHAKDLIGAQPATSVDVGAVALPIAASALRHATTPALSGAREGSVLADTSASDAAPQPADDDAVGDPQQPGIDQRAGVMPPPIVPPAAMPIVLPPRQALTAPIERPEESRSTLAAPQPGRADFARPALPADEGASIALAATPQPSHASLSRTDVADEAREPSPLTTAPKHQSYAFTRTVPTSGPTASASLDAGAKLPGARLAHTATSIADHALPQPASQTGPTFQSEPNDGASDVVRNAAAPLLDEARVSFPTIGTAPATVAPTDAAVADRTASPRMTPRTLPLSVGTPQQGSDPAVSLRVDAEGASIRGDVQAPASGAALFASIADASGSTIVPEPSRSRGTRPAPRRDERDQASGKTLVAGVDARVSLIGGVPLPVAAVSQMAYAISAGDRSSGLSPVLSRAPAAAPTGTVPGVVSSAAKARDGVSPILNQAAGSSMPAAIGATGTTIPSPAPSSDAAMSFASPIEAPAASAASVPIASASTSIAPAASEQPGARADAASGATAREAAPIAPPLRAAPEVPATPLRPTSAPAAQVFAAAIHRALGEQDTRQPGDATPMPAPLAPAIPGIAAAGAVQQGALDLRHEHWPAVMIERIVTLRDMAAENDTRLRLSPDMLGTIDVSLKRDGDQVQVQITAEQAQTRQLLAEAQPRLTELADARGVKLQLSGGNAGGAGQQPGPGNSSGGGDAPRQQAPATSFPTRPRSAEHGATDDTDQRIA